MSETTVDTRQGLTDSDVAELQEILSRFSERVSSAALNMLVDDGVPVQENEGETAKETLARVADSYPIETAAAAMFAVIADDLMTGLFG